MARRNRGVIYSPKICTVCGDSYIPTSGRQIACTKQTCQDALTVIRAERRAIRYAEQNPRITEKQCEWNACPVIFAVASTGVIPQHCDEHRKERNAPGARAAMVKWREQTLDTQCRYWNCERLQHPSAQGWCYFHYPILSMHNLSADAWWEFHDAQNGLCPICLESLFDGRVIAIDHDHALTPGPRHDAEHTRGLLHANPCNNVVLGGIETAIANGWLERALVFIKFPPSESN